MEEREARQLLEKYLQGKCNKEESEFINRWYHSLNGEEDTIKDPDDVYFIGQKMLNHINRKIDGDDLHIGKKAERNSKFLRHPFLYWKQFAAAVILFLSITIVLYRKTPSGVVKIPDLATVITHPSINYLPDGSVVWLKGESRLVYPEKFTEDVREITLVGEAFFDIVKDPSRPFIIHTANFTTTVLGTSFNIKAYDNGGAQEVAVVTGKVLVSIKEDADQVSEIILEPNQKAIIQKDSTPSETEVVEFQNFDLEVQSKLVFDRTALGDILQVLNSTHGVNISLSNENMKNCILTVDLTDLTVEMSMEILTKAVQAEYTTKGNDFMIIGEGCGTQS